MFLKGSGKAPYSTNLVGKKNPHVAPQLKQADDSKHLLVLNRSCARQGCVLTNCTKPNKICALTPDQARNAIKPLSSTEKYKDLVVGNLTHRVPQNKIGLSVDKQLDYAMNKKEQSLVVEERAPRVLLSNVVLNKPGTTYMQENLRHNTMLKHTLPCGSTIANKIENKK